MQRASRYVQPTSSDCIAMAASGSAWRSRYFRTALCSARAVAVNECGPNRQSIDNTSFRDLSDVVEQDRARNGDGSRQVVEVDVLSAVGVDDVLLAAVHPSGEDRDQKLKLQRVHRPQRTPVRMPEGPARLPAIVFLGDQPPVPSTHNLSGVTKVPISKSPLRPIFLALAARRRR